MPAARSAVRILTHLARQAGPVPAAALARDLGLPRSSVYQLLAVLVDEGLVVHLVEERTYGLGLGTLDLGSAYTRQAPLARLARPLVARLADTTGHNAHLAVLHGRDVLYLVEHRVPYGPALVTDVDVRLPSHLTASGRAVLAALPAAQVRTLYPDAAAFVDRTGVGPTNPRALREVLRAVRERGWALEDGEVTPGLASVATAARDHTGHPVAAVALTFLAERVSDDERAALAAATTRATDELSRRLGGGSVHRGG